MRSRTRQCLHLARVHTKPHEVAGTHRGGGGDGLLLRYVADAGVAQTCGFAEHGDVAGVESGQAENDFEEGGLAGTRLADEEHEFFAFHLQRDVVQRGLGTWRVHHGDIIKTNHGTVRSGSIVSVRLGNDGVTTRLRHAENQRCGLFSATRASSGMRAAPASFMD